MEQTLMSPTQQQVTITSQLGRVDNHGDMRRNARLPHQVRYIGKLIESQQRIKAIGEQPVTVVNLNPFKLMVLGPLFDGLVVAANKANEAYSALVISEVRYQVDEGTDQNWSPAEFWPITLAQEFVDNYREKGGVFCVKGDLAKNPELAHTAEFKSLFSKADKQLLLYCKRLKQTADNEWNTPQRQGARNIHVAHRTAASILLGRGLLAKQPEWMEGDIAPEDVTEACVCGQDTKKGQIMCSCGYVLRPVEALEKGIITENHIRLESLTRKELVDLGISAFVAESSDEKPARLKAGKAKPLSQFEIKQQAALDAEEKKKEKPAKSGKSTSDKESE